MIINNTRSILFAYKKTIILIIFCIVILMIINTLGESDYTSYNNCYFKVEEIKRFNAKLTPKVAEASGSDVPLYIITPTYPRAEQMAELTRLAQTLMNVDNIVWIVSEDASTPTKSVLEYLTYLPLETVYLRVEMPEKYNSKRAKKPRGVVNRKAGLNWISENAKDGVLYFADDDNTYDIRIFKSMRSTRKVSMFPVGLIGIYGVSSPIVENGKVISFFDSWIGPRTFAVDMAGFAVNVRFYNNAINAVMPFWVGHEEDGFLKSLNITLDDIQPMAENCTKIWVWHTQARKKPIIRKPQNFEKILRSKGIKSKNSNIEMIYNSVP